MCGIAGFSFGNGAASKEAAGRTLTAMTAALSHRGPDGEGTELIAGGDGGLTGLGHRRLSILELSPAGAQPMSSRCGRYTLAFNGEIYNHRELRTALEARRGAMAWRGHSDTEVLLELVSEVGFEQALERLDGQFAIAAYDREQHALHLARDPFGEKPLYYALWGGAFLFGSELRALRAWPGFAPAEDPRAVADYFRLGFVPSPRCIHAGVHKLPPASWMVVRQADFAAGALPTPRLYWDAVGAALASRDDGFRGSAAEAATAVAQALRESTAVRMTADVPVGAFLSGGIDSSLTTALMQAQASGPVRTFTLGMDMPGYDETESARRVARALGTEHLEHRLSVDEVVAALPELIAAYDEPFADSSQVPSFLLSRVARREVKVVLSGDGGDELFGGYNRYFHGPALWSRASSWPVPLRRIAGGALRAIPEPWIDGVTGALGRLAPRELAAGRAGAKVHKLGRVLASVDAAEFHDQLLAIGDPDRVLSRPTPHTRLADRLGARGAVLGLAERAMLTDATHYLPDDVLTKVDRASMAVGLEVRTPFLSRAVFELAWRLPLHLKLGHGQGKRVLREVLARQLPRELFERPKMGFGVPIGAWLRGPLRGWAEDMLSERSLRSADALDARSVRALWQAHGRGRADHGPALWTVLMYLGWSRR